MRDAGTCKGRRAVGIATGGSENRAVRSPPARRRITSARSTFRDCSSKPAGSPRRLPAATATVGGPGGLPNRSRVGRLRLFVE
jgi:hypothetical protein